VDQLVGTFGENRGADTDLAQGRRTRAQMATQSARRPARGNGEENRSSWGSFARRETLAFFLAEIFTIARETPHPD